MRTGIAATSIRLRDAGASANTIRPRMTIVRSFSDKALAVARDIGSAGGGRMVQRVQVAFEPRITRRHVSSGRQGNHRRQLFHQIPHNQLSNDSFNNVEFNLTTFLSTVQQLLSKHFKGPHPLSGGYSSTRHPIAPDPCSAASTLRSKTEAPSCCPQALPTSPPLGPWSSAVSLHMHTIPGIPSVRILQRPDHAPSV